MSATLLKSAAFIPASIKDMDPKQGIVTGYAAHFGSLDSDGDIIMPGAFTKTIKEQGPDSPQPRIKHLLNHNTTQSLGKPVVLKEDNTGLYYESKIGTHTLALDFMKMVESGLITEHSIGYGVVRKETINPDADWSDRTTRLMELKLWEFSSLTAWGANMNTPLTGVKAKQNAETRVSNLIKAIKGGTFSDSMFVFLEDELRYIEKALKDLTVTAPNDEQKSFTLPASMKSVFDNQIKSLTAKS